MGDEHYKVLFHDLLSSTLVGAILAPAFPEGDDVSGGHVGLDVVRQGLLLDKGKESLGASQCAAPPGTTTPERQEP